MRLRRPAIAAAAALLAAATLTGPAGAQSAGVGTSLTTTKVLTAQLGEGGSILDLGLLTDEAQATIDSGIATPGSYSRLTLAKVGSTVAPANLLANKTVGVFEAKSSGPTTTNIPAAPAIDLSTPLTSGTVAPGALSATLINGVATSGLNAELSNLSVLGGIASVASVKSTLAAAAAGDNASGQRSASVTDVTVLDLGAVLAALGIDLSSLSLMQLAGLIDATAAQAGLSLPSTQTTMTGAINSINGAIDDLQSTVNSVSGSTTITDITGSIDSTTSSLLGQVDVTTPLPTTSSTVAAAVNALNALIDELQAELAALVADGLKALDGVALLRLEGVEVGVATKAVADVKSSVATVTGKVGKVSVGNVSLGGLDVVAAAEAVTGTIASVNTKLADVLGKVSPDLASLVKVSVLDKATEVTTANGYTKASAGITGATAVITPPASLATTVASINSVTAVFGDEVSDVLSAADIAGLGLSNGVSQLSGVLNLGVSLLSAPAVVKVAQVLAASNYRTGAAPVTPAAPELPRTGGPGGDGGMLLLVGGLAGVLALMIRRFLSGPALTPVRVRKHDR